jgi:hypothetical protein
MANESRSFALLRMTIVAWIKRGIKTTAATSSGSSVFSLVDPSLRDLIHPTMWVVR